MQIGKRKKEKEKMNVFLFALSIKTLSLRPNLHSGIPDKYAFTTTTAETSARKIAPVFVKKKGLMTKKMGKKKETIKENKPLFDIKRFKDSIISIKH